MYDLGCVLAITLAALPFAAAQTYSDCNPMKKSGCPNNPALSTSISTTDFTESQATLVDWKVTSGALTFSPSGAEFRIGKLGDGPTIQSNFYLFYGYVEITMQAAQGAGIVSSMVLESDDLDEIDWEWIGSESTRGQSNYFGKGNTTTYDRGRYHPMSAPQSSFHTYAVNWTQQAITWLVDGSPVRTVAYADALGGANYPQTPMNIRLGNWVAGDPKNAQGTIDWAGGLADFSQGPFSMFVKSVKVINYNPGLSYQYLDNTGSFSSIKVIGGSPANEAQPSGKDGSVPGQFAETNSTIAGSGVGPITVVSAPSGSATAPCATPDGQGTTISIEVAGPVTSTPVDPATVGSSVAAGSSTYTVQTPTVTLSLGGDKTGNPASVTATSVASVGMPNSSSSATSTTVTGSTVTTGPVIVSATSFALSTANGTATLATFTGAAERASGDQGLCRALTVLCGLMAVIL